MKKFQHYAAMALIFVLGGLSFFVLCAEDTPEHQMSLTMFIATKSLALASLYGCVKLYRFMEQKGIIESDNE